MHTSWSEIETIRQCLRKHHLRYKEGWTDREESDALRVGNLWHLLMATLYREQDASAPIDLMNTWRGVESPELLDKLAWMLDGYYERWGLGDPLWLANAKLIEVRFEQKLPDAGFGDLNLVVVIDLVVEIMGHLWVVDHKSSKHKPSTRDLEMADQWTLYCWALREQGIPVFGSVHNYARTDKLKRPMSLEERFSRTPLHRTDREVEEVAWQATLHAWLGKQDNGAPMSPGDHCFRRCGFFDGCLVDRRYGREMAEHSLEIRHYKKERQP